MCRVGQLGDRDVPNVSPFIQYLGLETYQNENFTPSTIQVIKRTLFGGLLNLEIPVSGEIRWDPRDFLHGKVH